MSVNLCFFLLSLNEKIFLGVDAMGKATLRFFIYLFDYIHEELMLERRRDCVIVLFVTFAQVAVTQVAKYLRSLVQP